MLPAAQPGESPRPDRRRVRHGQDRDAQSAGRGILARRRARVHGRRQRRHHRHVPGGRRHREHPGARCEVRHRKLVARWLPVPLLGHARGLRHPGARHHLRHGPDAALPPARPDRGAGRRARHRLPHCRRQAAAAHRLEGPARHAELRGRARQRVRDDLRQGVLPVDRRHPARPHLPRGRGRRHVLRRAGARAGGLVLLRRERPGLRERAQRGEAGAEPAGLRHVPALDALRALRDPARSGRRGQAEVRVLLRRGAPAVQRHAQGAARQDGAGREAHPLEGRGRLLHHAVTERHPRRGARPAVEPHPARPARLHPRRAEGRARCRRVLPREPGVRLRGRHPRARHRRGARLLPRRRRPPEHRREREGAAPAMPDGRRLRRRHAGRARRPAAAYGQVRHRRRPRVRLRGHPGPSGGRRRRAGAGAEEPGAGSGRKARRRGGESCRERGREKGSGGEGAPEGANQVIKDVSRRDVPLGQFGKEAGRSCSAACSAGSRSKKKKEEVAAAARPPDERPSFFWAPPAP